MLNRSVRLTAKQKEVLAVIIKSNPDGSLVDLDQILMNIRYYSTKQAMQFIIRALIRKGLIVKKGSENRRARRRVLLAPTIFGLDYARSLREKIQDEKAGRNLSEKLMSSMREVLDENQTPETTLGPTLEYSLVSEEG